ncbi:hypothetical protein SAMN05216557_1019 [Sphingomonas carotinifaciens]|uniref:Uncharacterized protein n=1 Tax=Sphingomonas carotinifaciens TaxID=1166323 RepID=A0A1G7EKT2_9SPHN|nr:hypothetical protein SAMN05216557_1019 [Sphingomonas carotinifaciens]
MRSGALRSSIASRCTRSVTMRSSISNGGSTWISPDFTVHGPYPSVSIRSSTTIVRSWCQPSAQFLSAVLSNKIARTGRACSPSADTAITPIGPALPRKGRSCRPSPIRTPGLLVGSATKAVSRRPHVPSSRACANSWAPSSLRVRSAERQTAESMRLRLARPTLGVDPTHSTKPLRGIDVRGGGNASALRFGPAASGADDGVPSTRGTLS